MIINKRKESRLILFCGLPCTLKTYLSNRLAGRLGYAYLPSKAVGDITGKIKGIVLQKSRFKRYNELAKVAHATLAFGGNIIVDGGFPTSSARNIVLSKINPNNIIIVHCVCDDSTRTSRLKKRATDNFDYENQSAKEILKSIKLQNDSLTEENPVIEFQNGKVKSMLVVNTSTMSLKWKGTPEKGLFNKINSIIKELLKEYEKNEMAHRKNEIEKHFDDLANEYDDTTEWRKNNDLLNSLQIKSLPKSSRILDIGTGTGLASEWYSKRGHLVTGIDISPKMLQKAAERLNFVVLGNGTKLPFIYNYFDLIIIRQCLHYVEAEQILQDAHRVLKKGGLIIISSVVCPNDKAKHFWREFKNATQPLRLEVFTSDDLKVMIEKTEFQLRKEIYNSLIRKEKIESIKKRARNIPGGINFFLKNMEQLTSNLFPELEFRIQNDHLIYRQYWVTLSAKKV